MQTYVDTHLQRIAALTDIGTAKGLGKSAILSVRQVAPPKVYINAAHINQYMSTESSIEILPDGIGIIPIGATVANDISTDGYRT